MTRFDGWPAGASLVLLVLLVLLVAFSMRQAPHLGGSKAPTGGGLTDAGLYEDVNAAVGRGENYYAFVTREHRARGYPLKPFVTVRPPFLALISGTLGPAGTLVLFVALVVATILAWFARLRAMAIPAAAALAATGFITLSCSLLTVSQLPLFHESWAGLLIALSMATRTPQSILAAVGCGFVATMLRETAAAYLCLMLVFAVFERRYREAACWGLALLASALLLALHAYFISPYVAADDLASQGWNGLGGWSFFVDAMRSSTLLTFAPPMLGQALVPLCLFGWLSLASAGALRVFGLLGGYCLMLMLFARPEANIYWALLEVPLFTAGLVFAVLGVARLVTNAALWRAAVN